MVFLSANVSPLIVLCGVAQTVPDNPVRITWNFKSEHVHSVLFYSSECHKTFISQSIILLCIPQFYCQAVPCYTTVFFFLWNVWSQNPSPDMKHFSTSTPVYSLCIRVHKLALFHCCLHCLFTEQVRAFWSTESNKCQEWFKRLTSAFPFPNQWDHHLWQFPCSVNKSVHDSRLSCFTDVKAQNCTELYVMSCFWI